MTRNGDERGRKRQQLLEATEKGFTQSRSGAAEKAAAAERRDWDEDGEGRGTLQKMSKHFNCTTGEGSEARRDLGPAHERIETAPLGQSYSAQLQESVREGAFFRATQTSSIPTISAPQLATRSIVLLTSR